MDKNIRTIDLFAGSGGLSLGFQSAGFKIVGAVDNWEPAIQTYRANFKDHDILNIDLSDIKESVKALSQLKPDLIVGGPPCQDFSHAGKRDETLGRADLTISFAKIISTIKPRWFVMENVDQIKRSKKLSQAIGIFKDAGYGLSKTTLDASYYGVPQKRKRFFMVGILNQPDEALLPFLEKKINQKPMTVRNYFGTNIDTEHYYRHPRNYNRRGVFSVDEPSPTIRGVNRPIPGGYPGHHLDTANDISEARPLTTKERAQIQTFPEDFIFVGTKTSIEQQIGNAGAC